MLGATLRVSIRNWGQKTHTWCPREAAPPGPWPRRTPTPPNTGGWAQGCKGEAPETGVLPPFQAHGEAGIKEPGWEGPALHPAPGPEGRREARGAAWG